MTKPNMTDLKSTSKKAKNRELHLGVSLVLAVLIGAFFLYLATRAIPIDIIGDYLRVADWARLGWATLAFVAIYSVCHGARVFRWYYLVRPLGEVEPAKVHRTCAVGFTAILLLPLRLGELVRPFLLARNSKLSGAGILATVVVERVIDGLIITGVLFVGLWTYQGEASIELARGAGTVAAAIFVPALVMCIIAYRSRRLARQIVMATLGRVSEKLATKIAGMLESFATGFGAMARRGDLLPFLGGTALYWTANVFSMWAFLRIGFDINVGPLEMVTVMAVLVVGIMVPAGPAMAGNFEYFLAQGMGLYVPIGDASVGGQVGVFAALLHLLQIAVIVAPGVWIMIRHRQLRFNRQTLQESKSVGAGHPASEGQAAVGPN